MSATITNEMIWDKLNSIEESLSNDHPVWYDDVLWTKAQAMQVLGVKSTRFQEIKKNYDLKTGARGMYYKRSVIRAKEQIQRGK